MTLTRSQAAWSQGAVLVLALGLIVALTIADRQRGDWVAGPAVLFVYLAALPVHLGALLAAWEGRTLAVRLWGVAVGFMTLAAQVALFAVYLRGGSV